VPVICSVSRNTQRSGIWGLTSTVCGLPFSTKLIAMIPPMPKYHLLSKTGSWQAEISYNSFADASATVKLFGWRLRVGGLNGSFILDGEQLHFEYQRGVRTDIGPGTTVPVGEIRGKEQLPF